MEKSAGKENIETESLIQYVTDGITDETTNKIILLSAIILAEFKER